MTRRGLLATAALGLAACAFDAVEAQEVDSGRADLPRAEVVTDTELS